MSEAIAGECSECSEWSSDLTLLIPGTDYAVCRACLESPHPCEQCGKRPCRCRDREGTK